MGKPSKKEEKKVNTASKQSVDWATLVPALIAALVMFMAPLMLDIKITRPKLLVLETGLYGTLFIWLALQFAHQKISVRKSLVVLPLAAYCVITAVFYFFSKDQHVALSELKRSLLSGAAYLVAANVIASAKKRNIVLISWMSGSFLAILYGIMQYYGGFWMIAAPQLDRVMSTFGNPIFFAAHIVIVLPVALGIFFAAKKRYIKLPLLLLIVSGIIALYFAKTRAAFLGFGFSMALFIWLSIKEKRVRVISLVSLAILGTVFFIAAKKIWFRPQAHYLIWRDTLVMWSAHPVTGTGPGTFHIYFPQYASKELMDIWPKGQFIVNDAHSEYIQYLSETGILGFGIFVWLMAAFFHNAGRILKKQEGAQRYLVIGMMSSAAGILVQNIFSVDMRFIISAVYLFFVMGLTETFRDNFARSENLGPSKSYGGLGAVAALAMFAFPVILKPYLAQQKLSSTPDFFDEKVMDSAKTIGDLEALAQQHPNEAPVFEKLGWVYAKEKNFKYAIMNYERSFKLDPKRSGPLNNMGNIYFLMGDRNRAIECWLRSLEINPDQVDSRLNLAIAYYYNGDLKQSVDHLKKVLQLEPGNEKAIIMLKQMVE